MSNGTMLWIVDGELRGVVEVVRWHVAGAGIRYGVTSRDEWIPAYQLRTDASPSEDRERNRAQGEI